MADIPIDEIPSEELAARYVQLTKARQGTYTELIEITSELHNRHGADHHYIKQAKATYKLLTGEIS